MIHRPSTETPLYRSPPPTVCVSHAAGVRPVRKKDISQKRSCILFTIRTFVDGLYYYSEYLFLDPAPAVRERRG